MAFGFSSKHPAITLGGHNKTLELSPGVLSGSVAKVPLDCCRYAVVGGAAQLYVRGNQGTADRHLKRPVAEG